MSSEKRVQRTTKDGAPVANFRRIESTTDAEAKPEPETTDDAGLGPRAKRRAARIRAFFASPIKASAASTPGQQHTSALRDHAFDTTPSDYRSMLAKHRNRGGE